ncbi:RNA polymerase I subunit RpI1 [Arctopsyche grandis]|uniref:RNA polymerase I subunit RpI1 n=1 Tax=Arctopsyche grandis TaxID=121162 RepID=UPI00406D725B
MANYKLVDPHSIHFSIFSSQEIKELSVTKISTPLTFDSLGHPITGGLYDPLLGPINDKDNPCGTCFRTLTSCPGHFGHIELPMPVVNPLFHKTIYTLLSNSCLICHKFQLSSNVKNLLGLKLQLIDAGLITDALDVDFLMPELIKSNVEDIFECKSLKKYVQLLNDKNLHLQSFSNKNSYKIYDKFLNDAIRSIKNKACLYCKQPLFKISKLNNKLTYAIYNTENNKLTKKVTSLMPDVSRDHLRELWNNDRQIMQLIVPVLKSIKSDQPMDIFFLDIIPVPPPAVRPCNILKSQVIEHPQTQVYKTILKAGFVIRTITQYLQIEMGVVSEEEQMMSDESKFVVKSAFGDSTLEKLHNTWQEQQSAVDCLISNEGTGKGEQGLKQIIEKKDGVIRLHMMGKRVNFAARSVITPDPNISIGEIGIPEAFAMKLTYPVPVTSWNVDEMRKMVINGPEKHPGAVKIEDQSGKVISIPSWDSKKRESLAMRLLTPDENKDAGVKIVHRHLINGDVLLLNRQPTLHKPSIMAHKARVLKGEKTLRMHYANCKSYNADFDGDEMNAHFPQNEIARSEGYHIMNVNNQYLVPKDGTPLSGLIQDHVISGVALTVRGKFFTKADYQQLVFQSLSHLQKKIILLPPTILKPCQLWSGKQVISTLIINITPEKKTPITLIGIAKISSKAWQRSLQQWHKASGTIFSNSSTMSESEVIIRNGELLSGVLDKAHFGATPYGLVHSFFELYGGNYSSTLLSSLAKLFTYFLQWEGFTLGVKDILVVPLADQTRSKIIKKCRAIGNSTAAEAVGLDPDTETEELVKALEIAASKDSKFKALLDRKYKSALDKFTNDINKTCLPLGLLMQFPSNNLQLMVQSGAKGSTVNTMQISCLLGQIELEGKRPPLMVSGRSLPSFPPFETSPRAGGFIDGRFMTGIQPQEFFFHCMAGREGLIDTAVKTSKSGYLQRCLIKHLEGIAIKYDMTVRDSDNSIVQFAYGEDGMDVCKSQFFNEKHLKFLDLNTNSILNIDTINKLKEGTDLKKIEKHNKSIKKWNKKFKNQPKRSSPFTVFSDEFKDSIDVENSRKGYDGRDALTCSLIDAWNNASGEIKQSYNDKYGKKCPDPIATVLRPDHNFGVINEKLAKLVDDYLKKRDDLLNIDTQFISSASEFKDVMSMKAIESLAVPGEPVGLLAAQSIGEPSTQMTLNTFHFAGRGDMNVTLGIPRLREILMMASLNLKTPSMDIPFLKDLPDFTKNAEKLQRKLCRITVENILHKIDVHSELRILPSKEIAYALTFHFLPRNMYKNTYNITPQQILNYMEKQFFTYMFKSIFKMMGKKTGTLINSSTENTKTKKNEDDEEGDIEPPNQRGIFNEDVESSDEEQGNEDDDDTQARIRKRHTGTQEYDDPESEEEENSDAENVINATNKDLEDEGFEDDDVKPDIRSMDVTKQHKQATNYTYDKENSRWCRLVFDLPLSAANLDMTAILRNVAEKCVIKETRNIKRAIIYPNNSGEFILKTEGINMVEMFKYDHLLDLNKLYSNDIHAIARTYGIEAACNVIIKEVQNVFGVYGINVDRRHLSLISDYMTYNGIFEPMSRKGMESSTSPLQQMSFESSLTFLKDAAIKGKGDALQSASSCLMLGQPCKTGTGLFSLYNTYDFDK